MTEPDPPLAADVEDELKLTPTFRSDVTVELVKASAADSDVVWAARVSTAGEQSIEELDRDPARSSGLIGYLLRNRHGTPFEHNSMTFLVSAPIFVFREFHRHRIGWCLTGDTEVTLETVSGCGRTLRRQSIRELFTRWHHGFTDSLGRHRRLRSSRDLTVRVLNEETQLFERGRIVDVYESGVKEVMEFATEDGKTLRCSGDHAIYTADGWVKAGDLDTATLVAVTGKRSLYANRQCPPALRRGIGVWTSMQRTAVIKPLDRCHLCGELFDRDELVIDHVVPVAADLTLALDVTNLAPACRACHRGKTNAEQNLTRRGSTAGSKFVRVVRIDHAGGEEPTYDLEVEGPWHNFLANGVVVHNSYNEESGRYRELKPVFYVPGAERKLVQVGKAGAYTFVDGTEEQHALVTDAIQEACATAYARYQDMLRAGVAREVARAVLPVGTYSSMYATCNARSLMAFLSLRTKREDARFPSYPQREIEMVAEKMEEHFARLMPITYGAFNAAGRVSP